MNCKEKTIRRYENGAVQQAGHDRLLRFLSDAENMKIYLAENETGLDDMQKQQMLDTIAGMEKSSDSGLEEKYMDLCFTTVPCKENGFKGFDYDKLCAMVLFFADQGTALLKTKLMKLLHYADMIFYKEHGISMSGLRYVHCPYGPVPEHFDFLIGKLEKDHIAHIEVSYADQYELHKVIGDKKIPDGILKEEELAVLHLVYDRFRNFGSVEISEYSHQEKGYVSTKQGEVISYDYAKEIDLK